MSVPCNQPEEWSCRVAAYNRRRISCRGLRAAECIDNDLRCIGARASRNNRQAPPKQTVPVKNMKAVRRSDRDLGKIARRDGRRPAAPICVDVVAYAEAVTKKGFDFMDTPGYDPVAATGQVAGGANLVCFTHRARQRVRLQAVAVDQACDQLADVQAHGRRHGRQLRHHPRRRGDGAAMRPAHFRADAEDGVGRSRPRARVSTSAAPSSRHGCLARRCEIVVPAQAETHRHRRLWRQTGIDSSASMRRPAMGPGLHNDDLRHGERPHPIGNPCPLLVLDPHRFQCSA